MDKKQPKKLIYQFALLIVVIMGTVLIIQLLVLVNIKNRELKIAQNYIENIVSSVEHTIAANLENIERAGFAISYSDDLKATLHQNPDSNTNITTVLDLIKLIYYNNQGDVLDVSLVDLDGSQRSLLMGVSNEFYQEILGMYDFSDKTNTDRKFVFFDPGSEFRTLYYIYLAPLVDTTSYTPLENSKIATIVFIGEITSLKKAVNVVDSDSAIITIVDQNDAVLWSNQEGLSQSDYIDSLKRAEIMATKNIYGTDLSIVGVVQDTMSSTGQQILQYTFLSVLLLFIILIITFGFIRTKLLRPMDQLRSEIEQVGNDGLSKRLNLYDSYEINHISLWINNMLGRLETATQHEIDAQQKLFETEMLKNQAELYSLRTQINPHFLYNTLQCMRGIAMENDIVDLADMCTALFEIFRYSIKGTDITSIQKEVSVVRQYLHIFEIRYQGRFEYSIGLSDEVMELSIIKMTLQPIIENSILHGFQNYTRKMQISIQIWREENMVFIAVDDNGDGISIEKEHEINSIIQGLPQRGIELDKNSSFGLENVSRRMQLAFGDLYQFEIKRLEQGTRVLIKFPAIEYNRNQDD